MCWVRRRDACWSYRSLLVSLFTKWIEKHSWLLDKYQALRAPLLHSRKRVVTVAAYFQWVKSGGQKKHLSSKCKRQHAFCLSPSVRLDPIQAAVGSAKAHRHIVARLSAYMYPAFNSRYITRAERKKRFTKVPTQFVATAVHRVDYMYMLVEEQLRECETQPKAVGNRARLRKRLYTESGR